MIFKPSSLHKLFFTYICPRFYGGAPATPSNTTTTSTINQSPWQNPVYQALMLGTKDKPGPVTSMLRSSAEQTAAYNDMLKGGYSPVPNQAQYSGFKAPTPLPYSAPVTAPTSPYVFSGTSLAPAAPTGPNAIVNGDTQTSAKGGIMSLQGYKAGKTAKVKLTDLEKAQAQQTKDSSKLTKKQIDLINMEADNKSKGGLGTVTLVNGVPTIKPPARTTGETTAAYNARLQEFTNAGYTLSPTFQKQHPTIKPMGATAAAENLKNTIGTSIKAPTADVKPKYEQVPVYEKDPDTGKDTNVIKKDPDTGKDMYKDSTNIIGYESTNQDFLDIQAAARKLKTPEQYDAATAMYGKSTAGLEAAAGYKPTDVTTKKSDVANANAASYLSQGMNAPTDISAQGYDAAQANAAQLDRSSVRDIAAQQAEVERYKAEMMRAPSDISSQNYQAALADLNQMQGPKSWIDKGTSEAYMSPYMQNVVDIQKREANRDYAKQLQELNKQATAAGAYGGSRQAIERSEAARNQATKLADIQAQGQQQAYQSGMGQFSAEQGLGLQAGQANLSAAQQTAQQNQAATNQQRSQYIQQALQAAQVNYGGQLTAAQQNQVAQNAAVQFNASAQNLANNNYSAQQLQAQQANQGVDFNVGQMNTTNQQQTNLANQTATNQQRSQYVQQALEAAKVNYGGQLTAAQQNQIAANAAAQYNATNAQNVNLTNTAAENAANTAYTQNQLAAQTANQQAGLSANQQGIGALQGVGQNAAGLTSTGTAANQAGLANLGAQGQVAQAEQSLSQQGMTNQQQTAQNALDFTNQANAGVVAGVNSQPVQGGTKKDIATAAPGTWQRGGLIRNGKVVQRGKK